MRRLAAQQEIEKLRLLHGEGPVSAAEVDAAVADSSRFDVYKLVDAAVAGNAARPKPWAYPRCTLAA